MWETSDRRQRLPQNWNVLRLSILRRDSWRCQMKLTGCLGVVSPTYEETPPGLPRQTDYHRLQIPEHSKLRLISWWWSKLYQGA